jgi:hypothetical protein
MERVVMLERVTLVTVPKSCKVTLKVGVVGSGK